MSHPVAKPYVPKQKIRIVTAASLFDGHDVSINIMRRILQSHWSWVDRGRCSDEVLAHCGGIRTGPALSCPASAVPSILGAPLIRVSAIEQ